MWWKCRLFCRQLKDKKSTNNVEDSKKLRIEILREIILEPNYDGTTWDAIVPRRAGGTIWFAGSLTLKFRYCCIFLVNITH
jgi:hypothetical protein